MTASWPKSPSGNAFKTKIDSLPIAHGIRRKRQRLTSRPYRNCPNRRDLGSPDRGLSFLDGSGLVHYTSRQSSERGSTVLMSMLRGYKVCSRLYGQADIPIELREVAISELPPRSLTKARSEVHPGQGDFHPI
jgi:hypothetical protein